MRLIICVILTFNFTVTSAQHAEKIDSLKLWTIFTSGHFINTHAYEIASKNWPFTIESVAGCVISDELIDSIKRHNKLIWQFLDKNGYSNSEDQFYKEFNGEREKIEKAVDIFNANPDVVKSYDRLRLKNLTDYTQLEKVDSYKYRFTIYSFDLKEMEKEMEFQLIVLTNIKTETTRVVSKKHT